MKSYISKLLMASLLICGIVVGTSFAASVDVNATTSANYDIFHRVDRISEFSSTRLNDALNADGEDTEFLKLKISNNTYDGFNVFLTPTNGVFKAQNTLGNDGNAMDALEDGESDIAYSITVAKISGETGGGMELGFGATSIGNYKNWPKQTVAAGVNDPTALQIYKMKGDSQTTPTKALVSVVIALEADEIDKLVMAGRYHENIAVTYVDL